MCANGGMAIGVLKVLVAAGKAEEIKVIGFDNDNSVNLMIQDGKTLVTKDCFGSKMAADGINYVMWALQGEKHKGWINTRMELIIELN